MSSAPSTRSGALPVDGAARRDATASAQTTPEEAVGLSVPEPGIAVVELRDRRSRNGFTPAFHQGLEARFAQIAADPTLKVVVVHGYGTHFCHGGTRELLRRIARREVDPSELAFYDLLIRCELPCIAAMQGHATGGGLTLGCSADLVVLAREAIYTANFMRLGFTPGAGATLIVPRRLGTSLGHELLYTARGWRGAELAARGVGVPVVPAREVIPTALALARELADKPRTALRQLKAELTHGLRARLPAVLARELAMHDACFADPAILRRLEERYGA